METGAWTGHFLVLFLARPGVFDWLVRPHNWLHVTRWSSRGAQSLRRSVFLLMFSNYLQHLLCFLTTQIKAKGYNSAGAKTKGSFLQSERIFWIIFGAFYDFFVFYRLIFSLSVVLCVKVKLSLQKTNETKNHLLADIH